MTSNEKQFLKDAKQKKFQSINGNKIWSIILNLQQKQHLKEIAHQCLKKIKDHSEEVTKSLQKLEHNVTLQLNNCSIQADKYLRIEEQPVKQNSIKTKQIEFSLFSSKIARQKQQFETILSFFNERKITSAKLLYRASQNGFSVEKFHKICDGIPNTLVLIESSHENKKIGGFTPIEWKDTGKIVADKQKLSFIFSLTECDKFELKQFQSAVYHDINYGPTFGDYQNIQISDKGNCVASLNLTYQNPKYQSYNAESWQKYIGTIPYCGCVSIRQWQVWSLEFQNNYGK